MVTKKINIDYIGVVKEDNGAYKFEQMPIIESVELKETLKAMCNNPNRTLLDMQDAFAMQVNTENKVYNYCLPYSYSSAYIDYYIFYPELKTYETYQADKDAKIQEITALVKNDEILEDDKAKRIKNNIQEYDQLLKDSFLSKAIRYIEAMDFTATCTHLRTLDSVKMFSHESARWTDNLYHINEDLIITVRTNFAYGSSARFFVNVCYKGIDLLTYTDIVKYYYANMQDIIQCTRNYTPARESWQTALAFVADLSNKTKAGIDEFAHNWIRNEVTEMMDRLQHIKREPKLALDNIIGNSSDIIGLESVRNITADEIQTYKTYPDEFALIFKVEKISNALALLAKLKEASIIYEDAISAIEEIKELNIAIAPEIKEAMERLKNELDVRQKELAQIENELDEAEKKKAPWANRFDEISIWLLKRKPRPDYWSHRMFMDNLRKSYTRKYPEYAVAIERSKELAEKRANAKKDIRYRELFMERLQKCYNSIADAGLLAA